MALRRVLSNLTTPDLQASRDFYVSLFGFEVAFESDWFVNLKSSEQGVELGLIAADHAFVPSASRGVPRGTYLTYVVEEVAEIHERAVRAGYEVVATPENTAYGQRRMLLRDPGAHVLDVSSPIPGFVYEAND